MLSREVWLLLEVRKKTKEVIHEKEPRYEETTLVSETGSVKSQVLASAVVLNHIFITQPLPQQEKTLTGSHRGVHDLLK